jgi:D-glucuronyl C5-epimerase C-terminus
VSTYSQKLSLGCSVVNRKSRILVIWATLVCGIVLLLIGAEAYHYDWDWNLLVFRNRQIIAGLPTRVLCEAEMLLNRRADGNAKGYGCLVRQAVAVYKAEGDEYRRNLQGYTSSGDFLNYGLTKGEFPNPDTEGIPRVQYSGRLQYNPVTVANFALTQHGRYLRGDQTALQKFLSGANYLLRVQDSKGALRYQFAWKYFLNGETYEPGWTSGLAQGLALSVFARAYHLTGDKKYLDAGDKAFEFLVTPIDKGGLMDTVSDVDPSLAANVMFEEYLAKPSGHTLGGFMLSLLGLYDWSHVSISHASNARSYFDRGIETLKRILPYYDIGGFTAYDLGYITYHKNPYVNPSYHSAHVFLLYALASITDDVELSKYEKLWASYVPQ